jgi:transposase
MVFAPTPLPSRMGVGGAATASVQPLLPFLTAGHSMREVFNGLRWIVRAGAAWWMMPHDLPQWYMVY